MSRLLIALIVTFACGVGGGASGLQKDQPFPYASKNGRATVQYRQGGLTLVANYDYSQRNHDQPWLLIDVALGSNTRFVLHRSHFSLATLAGQRASMATQQQGQADPNGINTLIPNARRHRQNLDSFFPQRGTSEELYFFSLALARSIWDEGIVDNDRITMGALLFRSLDGGWPEGTYRLVLDNEHAKATLTISLQFETRLRPRKTRPRSMSICTTSQRFLARYIATTAEEFLMRGSHAGRSRQRWKR